MFVFPAKVRWTDYADNCSFTGSILGVVGQKGTVSSSETLVLLHQRRLSVLYFTFYTNSRTPHMHLFTEMLYML